MPEQTLSILFVPGLTRDVAALSWVLFMAWSAWSWMGLSGIGLVCVASTGFLRKATARRIREFTFEPACLERIWVAPWAVCVYAGAGPQWLCRDEVPGAAWAELLRCVYRDVPD